jgi:hypothetical protein
MSKSSDLDVGNGKKTVTAPGTHETLATSTEVLSVTIKALSTNTGKVYVGDHTVAAANGFELDPRDSIDLSTDDPSHVINLNSIYLDVAVAGEGVSYFYLRL